MRNPLFLLLILVVSACAPKQPVTSPAAEPVRGVWLTNVDSEVLFSREGIEAAVDLCAEYGFNHIFAVTWNRGHTLYPSKVMQDLFGVAIDPALDGRDPLRELLDAAHARGIKVYAWFEFGFSCSYQEADGGHIIRQRPSWAAIGADGKIVSKNGFQWMNAFDPEVQDFMLSLLTEVAGKYPDLDGIQGDDRLPALPSEAGYDSLTIGLFQAEHHGALPPPDHLDSSWVDWRARRLNGFMERMHHELKAVRPGLGISVSPSIFPWSKEQYLQDWPTWVREGWVDMVCPQVYRYDIEKYRNELRKIAEDQVPPEKRALLSPGILLKVGDYYAGEDFLREMISENRRYGIGGEVFFFYEGLKRHPSFFRDLYRQDEGNSGHAH